MERKNIRRSRGGISYETKRRKYKVTYKGEYVGRFDSEEAAQEALSKYMLGDYVKPDNSSFEEVYEAWYRERLEKAISETYRNKAYIEASSAFKGYRASYNAFEELHQKTYRKILYRDLKRIIDTKNPPMQKKIRLLMQSLAIYAYKNNTINADEFMELSGEKDEIRKMKN